MNAIAFALATINVIAFAGLTSDLYALAFCWLFVYVLICANESELARVHRTY